MIFGFEEEVQQEKAMNTAKRFVGFRRFPLLSILLLLLGACGSLATAQEASESARVPSNSIAVTPSPSNILGSTGGVTSAPETGPSRFQIGPKAITVQTLRHGADLELLQPG